MKQLVTLPFFLEVARYVNQRQMSSPFQLQAGPQQLLTGNTKEITKQLLNLVERIIENDEEKPEMKEKEPSFVLFVKQSFLSKYFMIRLLISSLVDTETTSHTLTMCFYRMLKNPEIYAKLKAEIRRNSEQNLNPVTTNGQQDHENFPYLLLSSTKS